MRETTVSMPVLSAMAITRVMLGAGLALLAADRLDERRRKGIGGTLLVTGALSTVPLAMKIMKRSRRVE